MKISKTESSPRNLPSMPRNGSTLSQGVLYHVPMDTFDPVRSKCNQIEMAYFASLLGSLIECGMSWAVPKLDILCHKSPFDTFTNGMSICLKSGYISWSLSITLHLEKFYTGNATLKKLYVRDEFRPDPIVIVMVMVILTNDWIACPFHSLMLWHLLVYSFLSCL